MQEADAAFADTRESLAFTETAATLPAESTGSAPAAEVGGSHAYRMAMRGSDPAHGSAAEETRGSIMFETYVSDAAGDDEAASHDATLAADGGSETAPQRTPYVYLAAGGADDMDYTRESIAFKTFAETAMLSQDSIVFEEEGGAAAGGQPGGAASPLFPPPPSSGPLDSAQPPNASPLFPPPPPSDSSASPALFPPPPPSDYSASPPPTRYQDPEPDPAAAAAPLAPAVAAAAPPAPAAAAARPAPAAAAARPAPAAVAASPAAAPPTAAPAAPWMEVRAEQRDGYDGIRHFGNDKKPRTGYIPNGTKLRVLRHDGVWLWVQWGAVQCFIKRHNTSRPYVVCPAGCDRKVARVAAQPKLPVEQRGFFQPRGIDKERAKEREQRKASTVRQQKSRPWRPIGGDK
eukprot:TRINITY_DN2995_c1_g2_i2.p2 TRINITY_DN2995_c1_g2~~TRINITY_DN2995_c1_g2_i2.p2  ORF type:complete len:404 (+),score=141.56 TRINITY_DN2995_c1_g2_i2:61-1272(+)